MQPEVIELLTKTAASIGVSVEVLWAALVQQGWLNIGKCLAAMGVTGYAAVKLGAALRTEAEAEYSSGEKVTLLGLALAATLLVFLLVLGALETPTGYAAETVIQAIGGK